MPGTDNDKRLKELESKWLNGTITPEEAQEYAKWYNADDEEPLIIPGNIATNEEEHRLRLLNNIYARTIKKTTPVRKIIYRYAAAAAIILILGTTAWLYFNRYTKETIAIAQVKDVLPGSERATLTLSDGTIIELDSAANGQLAIEGSSKIIKEDGQLVYTLGDRHSPLAPRDAKIIYNTMSTPRGGKYKLNLPDGSEVWLNAASSITYPTVFTGKERKVQITGEAYFEVKKDAAKPFIVDVDGQMQVQVLGTQFNVNSYRNENSVQATLVEGKVKVIKDSKSVLLSPGEQSDLKSGQLKKSSADIEKVTAWKENRFIFDGDKLSVIMRQLERWYDVDVIIEGNQPDELFSGILSRNKNVSEVFKMLQKAGNIQYRVEGKRIYVKP